MRAVCFCAVLLALAIPRAAEAQRVYEADATANVGLVTTRSDTFVADPNAEPGDMRSSVSSQFFSELRPTVAMQGQTPRLLWRLGYQFSGTLALDAAGSTSYNNGAEASLNAQATKFTLLTLSASATQGSTFFLLTSRPADMATPDVRAPNNPAIVSSTVAESLTSDIGRRMTLSQNLVGTFSAPQDELDNYSASGTATLGLERGWPRDRVGFDLRSTVSYLQPQNQDQPQYRSYTNGFLARWSRDFSQRWNGLATAGAEQVYTDTGAKPLAIVPVATLSALWSGNNRGASLEFSHGTITNIQVGTVSVTDRIAARGVYQIDPIRRRSVAASVGFLHNEPIGESAAIVAAGTGNAAQLDAAFITEITNDLLFTARFSVAYQWGQSSGIDSSLAQILLLGITARWSNVDHLRQTRPRPARGRRVDRTDDLFPVIEDVPIEE